MINNNNNNNNNNTDQDGAEVPREVRLSWEILRGFT